MKTLVVNLDRSLGRMEHMRSILDRHRLPFDRFTAIDGLAVSEPYVLPTLRDYGRKMTKGELGCLLSHRAIWQRIADGPDPHVMVLEDDVTISDRLPAFLSGFEQWIGHTRSFDIVKLETMEADVSLDACSTSVLSGIELHRLRSTHFGSAGYILSRRAAKRLARGTASLDIVTDCIFDKYFAARLGLVVLQAIPALVVQEAVLRGPNVGALASIIDDIGDRHVQIRIGPHRKLARELGRLWTRVTCPILWNFGPMRNSVVRVRVPFDAIA
ncbi:glycosyltransferase family 25 protein [Telmatospirillum sp.]|uniref:glycosyltransferase family 25 protein n=1 Tax=Telmatospirillum sp. TaxID=2079197 RepID=UPI00284FA869|nr:glycosyltransferase family 25 protein [Telmatospirillum sp.]MDR3437743.1 glycosyltransferase family 25 protein [Telmatospirillum sp.]